MDGRIDGSGGLPLLRRMRLRHRANGMVPPGRLALVAMTLGVACVTDSESLLLPSRHTLRTRPTGKAPSSTAALVAAPHEGQCHRQRRFAFAVATRAAAALPTAEPFRVRSPSWRPGSDGLCRRRRRLASVETNAGWRLCNEGTGSVPQGPPPGNLDLGPERRTGRDATQRRLASPAAWSRPGRVVQAGRSVQAPSGLRTLRASARWDRRAGSVS